ncbi:MAG: MmgE/PrpD family protein [Planctomycetota bacterium]|nr:MmgE/PrpD family protein [Planctomycetota bacterium]MEC9158193.1 MmgE/PrpD family protein [Planctomycetota bacterium]MED5506418.1 MmgE/PrpD family protein [Planctomycetota bacterium]
MTTSTKNDVTELLRNSNQALGIGEYAVAFMDAATEGGAPDPKVLERTMLFFTDSILCGVSALALGTNAPRVLRDEALGYPDSDGVPVLGSTEPVSPEKAILANCSAVREWDSNGTNFGYRPELGHTAGEFGHNDFYCVAVAAAQIAGRSGSDALLGMVAIDEIRGRLAEVFSLKTYKIDHVVHGAIASAAVYGAMLGATAEQIESAIGMFVAHFIPWRAIRAGKQLSDSKGASAAISTEAAITAMRRSMNGFVGPRDIFRNPEAIWRQFEPTDGDAPFDLILSNRGEDFAVMGMHFKLGLYEHQSAGALQGLVDLVRANPDITGSPDQIESIRVVAYEPAYGIIGDPAKRDPRTRQSADHSMVFILSRLLRKAIHHGGELPADNDGVWKQLMLMPEDYSDEALFDEETRSLMDLIEFDHGGEEYDTRYPDGIPTSIIIRMKDGRSFDSGLVMYPSGHARNTTADLEDILRTKFQRMGELAMENGGPVISRLMALPDMDPSALRTIWDFQIKDVGGFA